MRGGHTLEADGVLDGGVFWHYDEIKMSKVHSEDMILLSVPLMAGHAVYQFHRIIVSV